MAKIQKTQNPGIISITDTSITRQRHSKTSVVMDAPSTVKVLLSSASHWPARRRFREPASDERVYADDSL
jgi:YbbR domain-containing protein